MRLATFEFQNRVRIGAVLEDMLVPLDGVAPDMLALISAGPKAWDAARRAAETGRDRVPLTQARLLAPIPRPHKNIFALGRNYAEHAKESAAALGEKVTPPLWFTKAPTTINGPFGNIVVDPAISTQVDWEVELGVVIGKPGRKVPRERGLDHVFGYTVLNDVSARDLQHLTSQFFMGKSLDGYCPSGPWIVTADEIPDPQDLTLRCRVNGVLKQEGHSGTMIFTIAGIVENLTHVLTLEPGDLIATGTPSGVGYARNPKEFLKPGDVLESEIVGIGMLRNPVVAA